MLDLLGVEPGRISGSLARRLALLAVVAPYTLAALRLLLLNDNWALLDRLVMVSVA
ncbi:MAG: hypothetical protein LAQ69_10450 [Acidobacteriia bacterium]|nr:hypothetical protein [Terriglobia bacterium]